MRHNNLILRRNKSFFSPFLNNIYSWGKTSSNETSRLDRSHVWNLFFFQSSSCMRQRDSSFSEVSLKPFWSFEQLLKEKASHVVFLLLTERMSEEHRFGPGLLRRCYPVLPSVPAPQAWQGRNPSGTSSKNHSGSEGGGFIMINWEREKKRENHTSEQFEQFFLGLCRTVQRQPMETKLPRRYSVYSSVCVCSLFASSCSRRNENIKIFLFGFVFSNTWGSFVWNRWVILSAICSSFRWRPPTCGKTTPSRTDRRCARWWGASTFAPSPSTEPWATSHLGTTGSKTHHKSL